MNSRIAAANRRILMIDDNRAIHEDFRKIFNPGLESSAALAQSEAALFGTATGTAPSGPTFQLDLAIPGPGTSIRSRRHLYSETAGHDRSQQRSRAAKASNPRQGSSAITRQLIANRRGSTAGPELKGGGSNQTHLSTRHYGPLASLSGRMKHTSPRSWALP